MVLRPLDGFVVGVTADRRWREQAELLERRGASVVHAPTVSMLYLGSDEVLRRATAEVIHRRPAFVVATTGIGVRAWFDTAQAWGVGEDLLAAVGGATVVARGPKAAAALQVAGVTPAPDVPGDRIDDVVAHLRSQALAGALVAFQHDGGQGGDAVEALRAAGAEVVEVPVYRWRLPADDTRAVRLMRAACEGRLDAVTFTSAPAVHNFFAIAGRHGLDERVRGSFNRGRVVPACVGPVCADAARGAGIDAPVAPQVGRLGLLVRELAERLQERRHVLDCRGTEVTIQGSAVVIDGATVDLAPRERAVLALLAERRGAVVPRAALLRQVWGHGADPGALQATVTRLRRRLGPAGPAIRAVAGRGYRLDV